MKPSWNLALLILFMAATARAETTLYVSANRTPVAVEAGGVAGNLGGRRPPFYVSAP